MKVTLDELERYGDSLNSISNEASKVFSQSLRQYLDAMTERYGDVDTWPKGMVDQLREYAIDLMVEVWSTYGDASSSVGSMFFEDVLGERMPEQAMMTDHVSRERAEASVRYWMKNLFGDQPDVGKFVDGCTAFIDRQVSHSADMAVIDGAEALFEEGKEIRYGRVSVGPTCGFCIMLASRGFVYASKKSAGDEGGAFNRFHDYCNCRVVAGYEGLEVEGYDYQGMYERYLQCRKAIGDYEQVRKDWNELTPEERDEYGRGERSPVPLSEDSEKDAEIRKQLGKQANGFNDYLARRIVQEMNTRDREWLYNGKVHEPTYATERVKQSVTVDNPWEDETARRLAKHGIKPDFIQDYKWEIGSDGIKRKVGLPDFANGVEIKTPISSQNAKGAVDNYLENCEKKKGLKLIIIDNTVSSFSDKELRDAIVEVMKDYDFDQVTYLGKDDRLHNVNKPSG